MNFVAVGGDARYAWMVALARREGMRAAAVGLERAPVPGVPEGTPEDISRAPVLVMPNPFDGGVRTPLSDRTYAVETLLDEARPDAVLALFGAGAVPEEVRARHAVWDMTADEELARELARQSAEGAVHAVCERADVEMFGCRALIVGYGRIGRALHRILTGYGAQVIVAARRAEAREAARAMGGRAVDMEEMETVLPDRRVIFSTPPQRVLDARRLNLIDREALLVDLSSAPYGVDLGGAHGRWLNAWREPGLPGRYCPRSAGAAMLRCLKRMMRGDTHVG